jgi:hypothetical protein
MLFLLQNTWIIALNCNPVQRLEHMGNLHYLIRRDSYLNTNGRHGRRHPCGGMRTKNDEK